MPKSLQGDGELYAEVHKLALVLFLCGLLAKNMFCISEGCKTKQNK